jgi:hypothetical protein
MKALSVERSILKGEKEVKNLFDCVFELWTYIKCDGCC